ncbi:mucin-2-like [Onychostoma macrolepis]|uniref:mucin-2-like n=1 Tax=Onychostoma macrolepis TaxID=369639 RepID=UPI002729C832|nr:mucin-2-like [Onychostoma macrolepis]
MLSTGISNSATKMSTRTPQHTDISAKPSSTSPTKTDKTPAITTTKAHATSAILKTTAKSTSTPKTTEKKTTTTTAKPLPTTLASLDPPTEKEGFLYLKFRIVRIFIQDYKDKTSSAYKALERNVTTELNRGYKYVFQNTFLRAVIIIFWPGSVGVTSLLIFQNQSVVPNITDIEDSLKQTINQSIVNLNVITSSISADPRNDTTSTTTQSLTTATTTMASSQFATAITSASSVARSRNIEVVTFLLLCNLTKFLLIEL